MATMISEAQSQVFLLHRHYKQMPRTCKDHQQHLRIIHNTLASAETDKKLALKQKTQQAHQTLLKLRNT